MSKSWFSITNKADAPAAEILIFDEIGIWGITAKDFADQLKAIPSDRALTVGINSPGGSVFDGIAIYNLLKMRGNVTTRVDGVAASIASVIMLAGDRRIMPENALVMIHEPATEAWGGADDLRETADVLDKIGAQIVAIYVARTGKTESEVRANMAEASKGTWMTGKEALAFGFCTELSDAVQVKASFDFRRFRNGPPPVSGPEKTEEKPSPTNTMKKLLEALVAAALISSADLTEDEAAAEFESNWKAIKEKLDAAEADAEQAKETAAKAAVAAAVQAKKIKNDPKAIENAVNAYKRDPAGMQAVFDSIETPAAPRRGAPPVPTQQDKTQPPGGDELKGRARMVAAFERQFSRN